MEFKLLDPLDTQTQTHSHTHSHSRTLLNKIWKNFNNVPKLNEKLHKLHVHYWGKDTLLENDYVAVYLPTIIMFV